MRERMKRNLLVACVSLMGCSRSELPIDELIAETCRSELPSSSVVRFDFPDQRCRFTLAEAAQGISFRYGVQVIAAEPAMVESAPPQYETCAEPVAGPNIYIGERISGGDFSYCECDRGLCTRPPLTMGADTRRIERVIDWTGRQWAGPSDTHNPFGAPFAPGEYAVAVSTTVGDARADSTPHIIEAKFYFKLVP